MRQLKMIRYRAPVHPRALPEGWKYALYQGTPEEMLDWLEICKNGLFGPNINEESFGKYLEMPMKKRKNLKFQPEELEQKLIRQNIKFLFGLEIGQKA